MRRNALLKVDGGLGCAILIQFTQGGDTRPDPTGVLRMKGRGPQLLFPFIDDVYNSQGSSSSRVSADPG